MYKKNFNISGIGGNDNSINMIERISSIAPGNEAAKENKHSLEQKYNGEHGKELLSCKNTELTQITILQLFEEKDYAQIVKILSEFNNEKNSSFNELEQHQIENQNFLLGMALLGLADYEKAKELFNNELEQNPNFQEAKYGLGLALYALGEDNSAMQYLESLDDKSKELLGLTNPKLIPSGV